MTRVREVTVMLSAAFIDWWFAPWRYGLSSHASHDADLLGRRDAYPLWCAAAGVRPALPARFDARWQVLALDNGSVLVYSAKLFGGLLAARQQQRELLTLLDVADRKWCMSIALVQPLAKLTAVACESEDALEICGLAELSWHLEQAFPGMWSRLCLLLPRDLESRVAELIVQELDGRAACEITDAASQRALRCWRLCRQRAEERYRMSPPIPTNDASET